MSDEDKPKLLHNIFEGCIVGRGKPCECFNPQKRRELGRTGTKLHIQEQDTESAAWHRLLELIEEAASEIIAIVRRRPI